jgi:hypothetical protein
MRWYWKVRIYRDDGHYYFGEIITERRLDAIDTIQDFYLAMTGCKMLLEGMSESSFGIESIAFAFTGCWRK